jgi:hypothetical protein
LRKIVFLNCVPDLRSFKNGLDFFQFLVSVHFPEVIIGDDIEIKDALFCDFVNGNFRSLVSDFGRFLTGGQVKLRALEGLCVFPDSGQVVLQLCLSFPYLG